MKKLLLLTTLCMCIFATEAQTIISPHAAASYCAGDSLLVNMQVSGSFNTNNTMTIQLSDATGSFSHPVIIKTLQTNTSGIIAATIPSDTRWGIQYRFRVVSNLPLVAGSDNGADLIIYPRPVLSASDGGCLGQDSLTVSVAAGAAQIIWSLHDSAVFSILTSGTPVTVAGGNGPGSAANQFSTPVGVFLDNSGYIFVSDDGNSRVKRFPPNSLSSTNGMTVAGGNGQGNAANQLRGTARIFVDKNDTLYVTDFNNHRIQKFPPNSTSLTNGITVAGSNLIGGSGSSELSSPSGIFKDSMGYMYVADYGNNRIQKFPPNSTSTTAGVTVAGGNGVGHAAYQLNGPTCVYVDDSSYIYVADNGNNRIMKFPPNSTPASNGVTIAGSIGMGSSASKLKGPNSICLDHAGNLYVSDKSNNRIQLFAAGSDSTTKGLTLVGSNLAGGSAATELHTPESISLDALGNVYIADASNNRIQKVSRSWSFTPTAAGIYTATYISASGCTSAMSDTVYVRSCGVGISDPTAPQPLRLYPNPNTGSFTLESAGDIGRDYSISDMLGRAIAEGRIGTDRQNIILKDIAPGSYIIEIKGSAARAVRFTIEP